MTTSTTTPVLVQLATQESTVLEVRLRNLSYLIKVTIKRQLTAQNSPEVSPNLGRLRSLCVYQLSLYTRLRKWQASDTRTFCLSNIILVGTKTVARATNLSNIVISFLLTFVALVQQLYSSIQLLHILYMSQRNIKISRLFNQSQNHNIFIQYNYYTVTVKAC